MKASPIMMLAPAILLFGDMENRAAYAARRATGIAEYSPYAELRDAMRKAIAAMDEIAALPAEVRERMEGGRP